MLRGCCQRICANTYRARVACFAHTPANRNYAHIHATRRSSVAASASAMGPVKSAIVEKLTEGLQPVSIEVTDNSSAHAGHSGNPSGSSDAESHFTVDVVSAKFEGVKAVGRHRLVYELIDAEMKGTSVPGHPGVHALVIKAKAPGE